MTKNIKASGIMTRNVVVANESSTFSQLMEFFTRHNIQHLPVASGDRLIGIVSVRDMARYLSDKLNKGETLDVANLDNTFHVKDVMKSNLVTVNPNDTVEKIAGLLSEGKFQAVPVVQDGLIHGIITNKDMVKVYKWAMAN